MKGEYYKMEFEAWDEGTIELTLEQEAAYLRLCHQMYRRQGPVANSPRLLCSIWRCGHTKAKALLKALVDAGKIQTTTEGALTNQRVTKVLADRESTSSKRRAAGERGGSKSAASRRNTLKTHEGGAAFASTSSKQIEAFDNIREERRGEEKSRTYDSDKNSEPRDLTSQIRSRDLLDKLFEAADNNVVDGAPGIEFVGPIYDLMAMGCDLDLDILPTIREHVPKLRDRLRMWGAAWLRDRILAARSNRQKNRGTSTAKPEGPESDEDRIKRWTYYASVWWRGGKGVWSPAWGPSPREDGCEVPAEFIERYRVENGYDEGGRKIAATA